MQKILTKLLVFLIILKIISPIAFIGQVFAVSNTWDFSNPADYIVSDSAKINLYNNQAKLKSNLTQVWRLNNWPTLLWRATKVEVSWNYAYVTAYWDNALEIIDISDTNNPVHVSSITMNNTVKLYWAMDLKVSWDYVFIASYVDDDIEIIDVSDKSNPSHITNIANSSSSKLNWPRWLDISWNYLYVASYSDNALQIIDISDPTNPQIKWYLKDNTKLKRTTSVKVSWNYAYMTSYTSDRLEVIDISDPDNPSFVWELKDNTWGSRLNWAWWIEVDWDYAYIASYVDDSLEIVDISDPTNPSHLASVKNSDANAYLNWAKYLKKDWNFVYISAFVDDAIQIIDVSNPAFPQIKWYVQDREKLDWASWVFINWNDLFAAIDDWWRFEIIDIFDKNNPSLKSELLWGPVRLGWATNILVDWNYAYISSYLNHSIEIVDVSDPSSPNHISAISASSSANIKLKWIYDLQKKWDYLYTANYVDDAITVIDVSDPSNPSQSSYLKRNSSRKLNWARAIDIVWNYAYIASYVDDALQIIDISDPNNITAKWYVQDNTKLDWVVDIKISGNYAFLSSYSKDRLTVVDISDKDNPSIVKSIKDDSDMLLNWAWWLELDWNYLIVSAYVDDWIQIFDISNKSDPQAISQIKNSSPTKLNWSIYSVLDEWYIYQTTRNDDAVQIIDNSNKNLLSPINYYQDHLNLNWAEWITKKWNFIYVWNYLQNSLEILKENYYSDSPYIIPKNAYSYSWEIVSLNNTFWIYNSWTVTYQISKDDWNTWYYFDWSSWQETTAWTTNSNSISEINDNIWDFNALSWWTHKFKFKAFLNSDWNQKVELDSVIVESHDLSEWKIFQFDAQNIDWDWDNSNEPNSWDNVSTWVDIKNWYNASQSTASNQAVYETNSINSHPSIKFDWSDDFYWIDNQTDINTATSYDKKSFAMILKTWNDVNTFQNLYEQGGWYRWYSIQIDSEHLYMWAWNNQEWDSWHQYKFVDLWTINPNEVYNILVVQDSSSWSDTWNIIKAYIDWALAWTLDHVDIQKAHSWDIVLWKNHDWRKYDETAPWDWNFFKWNIWEFISWNYSLSWSDIDNLNKYLRERWDLDKVAPIVSSTDFASWSILPWWNHSLEFSYSDTSEYWTWIWIDTSSDNIILERYNSSNSTWEDYSSKIWNWTLSQTWASYSTLDLDYWKYRVKFSIADNNWNRSDVYENTFYIDIPQLLISTWSVNIWELNDSANTFWETITVTVKTIWAGFRVKLKKNQALTQQNSWDIIPYYDGSLWMWYNKNDDWNLNDFNDDIILSNSWALNTDWELNIYTYDLKIWAIIDKLQVGWNYEWKIDFEINLDY